ncbi:YdbL family protein [Methylohalobius crimeensis]|uniref:YdbL family protein n=1 Tax=Methylohalobius crimeensis TaxID=244365 RepID=UPI0003B61B45|nr:YdbL family protein [Methylohalobius crimeensis]
MKKPISLFPLLLLMTIASCVTVNIYFPAAAAEKAADQIIRDIQKSAPDGTEPQSNLGWRSLRTAFRDLMSLGISSAHAAADLSIDSPEIRALRASMERRFSKLKSYLNQGWVGYANNGLVAVVNKSRIPLRERAGVEQIVAAENRDRQALYQAIARANGHPEWANDIQATFAKRWIANAQPGWWIQAANGSWNKK